VLLCETQGGTYYVQEETLTLEAARGTKALLDAGKGLEVKSHRCHAQHVADLVHAHQRYAHGAAVAKIYHAAHITSGFVVLQVVAEIVKVSSEGRAPKQAPGVFALALCCR
jgi:hypothetical protein